MSDKYFEAKFDAEKVVEYLKEIHEKLGDLTPLMKTASVFLKYTVDENFETEGTHTGDKWKEWSASWKKRRLAMGKANGKILGLDGHLRKDIRTKYTENTAIVGANKKYAAAHNFGFDGKVSKTSKKGKKFTANMHLPQREFMRINDTEIDNLLEELKEEAESLLLK